MDRSTVTGGLLGLLFVGGAIAIGPASGAFFNGQSLLIVLGGTLAATLVRFSFPAMLQSVGVLRRAFAQPPASPAGLAATLAFLATLVRKESLLAMEREPIEDPFLRRGIELCVDGIDPDTVESVLRGEVAALLEGHDRVQRLLRAMGSSAPAFGMIGTLIGLVQMLTRMDDPSKIGGSMAVAILTTFYGAFLAYMVFLPLADKLEERSRLELKNREIVIQGLMGILAGHHPRIVERRLIGLLEPDRGAARVLTVEEERTA